MLESFLNVRGKKALLEACVDCYASLFSERAIIYREEMGFDHLRGSLSVGVQRMVRSDKAGAGVMFSVDRRSGFPDMVVISAAWGLGENVVQGMVIPDLYKVFKPLLEEEGFIPIVERLVGDKGRKRVYASEQGGGTTNVETPPEERGNFVLEDEEILRLGRWACLIEKHYSRPMDMEWAKDGMDGKLYIVQARPVTGIDLTDSKTLLVTRLTGKGEPLLSGVSVGDGVVTGVVSLVEHHKKITELKESAILVSGFANTQWVPAIKEKRVKGIVTDFGGRNSHSAIISQELGIPAIVGTLEATQVLRSGQKITLSCVEGEEGFVYGGVLESVKKEISLENIPHTTLPVMMNAVSEDAAYRWWRIPCEGIGMASLSMIFKHTLRVHPMALLHPDSVEDDKERQEIDALTRGFATKEGYFVEQLSGAVAEIAASRYPAKVVVRFSDFPTEEYAALKGGKWFEPKRRDARFDFRGAPRYLSDHYREAFLLECRSIKRAREVIGLKNIHVMIPYCSGITEADDVLAMLEQEGHDRGGPDFEVHLSCDLPGILKDLELLASRFHGIFIPVRKLRRLFLGRDENLDDPVRDEDLNLGTELKRAVDIAHRAGSRVVVGGRSFRRSKQLLALLLDAGIDGLSVDPEWIPGTKRLIADIESGKTTVEP
jgi:pyruvate,water dikinase